MKLLIVDDSELIRDRLAGMLQGIAGVAAIQVAASLEAAGTQIKRAAQELLILDIHLNDGNAIQSITAFKRMLPEVRIAMLTNDATAFNRRKSLELGAEWFFDKSTEFELVVEVVRNLASGTET